MEYNNYPEFMMARHQVKRAWHTLALDEYRVFVEVKFDEFYRYDVAGCGSHGQALASAKAMHRAAGRTFPRFEVYYGYGHYQNRESESFGMLDVLSFGIIGAEDNQVLSRNSNTGSCGR
jgi:hypothetical protein